MDFNFYYSNPETAVSAKGDLKGLKIAVQPNISVSGWPADAGSKALADFRALEDSTVIKRVCEKGAFISGSISMSEFGFGLKGSCAGEALKHQMADAELVMDMAGESRLAASKVCFCGFKPGYGLISRYGLTGLIPSMECCGIISENPATIREILKTAAGPDEYDYSMPYDEFQDFEAEEIHPEKISIGVISEVQKALPEESREEFRRSVDEMKRAGFTVMDVSFPDFPLFAAVHRIAGSVEASSCAGRYDSVRYGRRVPGAKNWNEMYLLSRGASFGSLIKSFLFQGAYFQFERYDAYENACRIRARLIIEMEQLLSGVNFLVLPAINPVVNGSSGLLSEIYDQSALTLFANVTGQPSLFLPSSKGEMNSGFQVTGPRLQDGRLLSLGEHILSSRDGGK